MIVEIKGRRSEGKTILAAAIRYLLNKHTNYKGELYDDWRGTKELSSNFSGAALRKLHPRGVDVLVVNDEEHGVFDENNHLRVDLKELHGT